MQRNENFSSSMAMFFDDFAAKKEVASASAQLDFRTFYQRHAGLAKTLPWFHYGLFSVFSVAAASCYLIDKVMQMIPSFFVSATIALLLLSVLEYVKSYTLSVVFESWYYGLTHKGKASANPAALLFAFFLLAASAYLSIAGADAAASMFADKRIGITARGAAMQDSAITAYDQKIAAVETSLTALEANKKYRWGNLLSAPENQQILNYQNRIAALQTEKSAALVKIGNGTTQAAAESIAKAGTVSAALVGICTVNELAIVLCSWFVWFFRYKVRNERETLATAVNGTTDTGYSEHLIRMLSISGIGPVFGQHPRILSGAPAGPYRIQPSASLKEGLPASPQAASPETCDSPGKPGRMFKMFKDALAPAAGKPAPALAPEALPTDIPETKEAPAPENIPGDGAQLGFDFSEEKKDDSPPAATTAGPYSRVCVCAREGCGKTFTALHWKAKYCPGDEPTDCRGLAFEQRTGRKFVKKQKK